MFDKKKVMSGSLALILGVTSIPAISHADSEYKTVNDSYLEESDIKSGNSDVLKEKILEYADVEKNGDTGTITISDAELMSALYKAGYDVSGITTFADGKTTVKVHSWKKGNADIYLSKGFLNTVTAAGVGAAAGAIGALLPGAGWAAAIGAISSAIGAQSFENGKVFQIRGFSYSGSYNQ